MEKPDSELISETLAGNLQSYDVLMTRYQEFVYSIAYGFGRTKENALDITQDIFLKVYKKMKTFKENSTFKTWLGKVAYNEGVNWSRRNKKFLYHDDPEVVKNEVSDFGTQEDQLLAAENKTLLLRCLFELNTRYRLAVVLRYFENLSIKEIAKSLDCSEGVVKNMLFRSIQKLKNTLPAMQDGVNHENMQ